MSGMVCNAFGTVDAVFALVSLGETGVFVAAGTKASRDCLLGEHHDHCCVQPWWPVGCCRLNQTNCFACTDVQPVSLTPFFRPTLLVLTSSLWKLCTLATYFAVRYHFLVP